MNKLKIKKHPWRYIIFFLLLFLIMVESFLAIYRKHRSTVVEQQNRQLGIIAAIGSDYVKTYVEEKNLEVQNMFSFKSLGQNPDQIERKVEEKIKLYWNHSPIYLDYMKYFTLKELEDTHIAGLTKEELLLYQKSALKNNELVIGPMRQVNANNVGIYLFKGIFNEYGKYGVLACRINLSMVFHSTVSHIQLGDAGYLTLGDIDSNFYYCGNKDGIFFSTSDDTLLDLDKMLVGYSFTNLGDVNILISSRLPFVEIDQPIRITFYLLLSLSIFILIIFALFIFYLFHFRKKELEYTMELKLQEQMYKGNNNEVLGLFSRKIAHEYNNLLTPITIYCDLLEAELNETDETMLEYVKEIQLSSEQCSKLAKELLAYGHSNPSNRSVISFDSTETLKDAKKRIQVILPPQITLISDFPSEPVILNGQPLELVQILYNLCVNSMHAMEGKDGVLTIEYKVEGNEAVLTVEDTGHGIPKHLKQKIFASQFTTKSDGKGNGMGLAIVAGIVDKYKGTIYFDSSEGVGTTFTIRFPL